MSFMKVKFSTFLLSIMILNCSNSETHLYIGTYTDGDSDGIYRVYFDTENGKISNKALVAESVNPSFLTFSKDREFLYAVNEIENGTISSFKIDNDGQLSEQYKVSTRGAHPCHVAVNERGDKLVVSNYTGGNAALFSINEDGSLSEATQVFDHNLDSISAHVHSGQFIGDELFVTDLGRNAVYNYSLEGNNFKLKDSSIVAMPSNAGPRHFSLTKDGKFIYIINEYDNSVTIAKRSETGFELVEHVSTLAEDFKGDSFCADIHLSQDQQFLYGSNRGENSIVVFKRDKNSGRLERIQNISVEGDWPRNFTLDPTGNFLLVANQRSNNISVFKVDRETGELSFLNSIDFPSPVCLLF